MNSHVYRHHVATRLVIVLAVAVAAVAAGLDGAAPTTAPATGPASTRPVVPPGERIERVAAALREYGPPVMRKDENGEPVKVPVSGRVRTKDGKPLPADPEAHVVVHTWSGYNGRHHRDSHWVRMGADGRFAGESRGGAFQFEAPIPGYSRTLTPPARPGPNGAVEGVEIVLDVGFTGKVRLVDPQGRPIAGAAVHGGLVSPGGSWHSGDYTTDADGVVAFEHCGPEDIYRLEARADGFQNDQRPEARLAPDRAVAWELKPTRPTTGQVFRQRTTQPVAGARIYLRAQEGPFATTYEPPGERIATADDQGRFTLRNLRDDTAYDLFVDAPGHGFAVLYDVLAGQPGLAARLGPELYVSGTVVGDLGRLPKGSDGKPHVSYTNARTVGNGTHHSTQWVAVDVRDGVGHFKLPNLWPGQVDISAGGWEKRLDVRAPVEGLVIDPTPKPEPPKPAGPAGPAGPAAPAPPRPAPPAGPAEPPEPVEPTRKVVIRFEPPAGSPPPEGAVEVEWSMGKDRRRSVRDDAAPLRDGEVRLDVPVPNFISLKPGRTPGYLCPGTRFVQQKVPEGEGAFVWKIPAIPAGAAYGQVRAADGSPARDADVLLLTVEPSPLVANVENAAVDDRPTADEDTGKFVAAPLPLGGTYVVAARRGRRLALSAPFTPDAAGPTREVPLTFADGVTLAGRVLGPARGPAAGVSVSVGYKADAVGGRYMQLGPSLRADIDGRFAFPGVNPDLPGPYTLIVVPARDARPAVLPVKPNDTPEVRLQPGAVVQGTIFNSRDGSPLVDAEVFATPVDGKAAGYEGEWPAESPTNAKGEFRFSNLADGQQYRIRVRRAWAEDDPDEPDLVKGGQQKRVELHCKPQEW